MIEFVPLERPKIKTDNYMELNIPNKYKTAASKAVEGAKNSRFFKNIQFIALFGSCYKQKTKYGSDIDLFIVTDNCLAIDDIFDIDYNISCAVKDIEADIVIYTEEQWKSGNAPLTRSLKTGFIMLYKRGEET